MPTVYPFRAVHYTKLAPSSSGPGDISDVVAPPYDVLDAEGKKALQAKSPRNIVSIDLPHLPAKELGPPAAYEAAAAALKTWLADGTLKRADTPLMFVYRETFTFAGKTRQRTGMACALKVQPFGAHEGGGILPHEETFSGPKEDRMALMKATKAQMSPIFGLHQDEHGRATALLQKIMAGRGSDAIAKTREGFGGDLLHEVWIIADAPTQKAYADALAGEDVFIADGHHRYTTQLNYIKALEAGASGAGLAADHPARRCMFVLIGMSDPGMVIGPTHRVLGGMAGYSWDNFDAAAGQHLKMEPVAGGLKELHAALHAKPGEGRLGLWDFATRKGVIATPSTPDPLAGQFPKQTRAWRTLDVALCQYLIVERICQPAMNGGQPVKWAFPHSIEEVDDIGAGHERGSGGGKGFVPQLAVIVRPTPLEAVREVSRAGELMPQKSTFFYPKLATGLFVNPLE
jgi:uncharacterized protein (DUF1015 family)